MEDIIIYEFNLINLCKYKEDIIFYLLSELFINYEFKNIGIFNHLHLIFKNKDYYFLYFNVFSCLNNLYY